jgi:hypothetical protein
MIFLMQPFPGKMSRDSRGVDEKYMVIGSWMSSLELAKQETAL